MEAGGPIARLVGTALIFCVVWVATFAAIHFIIFFYNNARRASHTEGEKKAAQKIAFWFGVVVGAFAALHYFANFYSD